MPHSSPAPIRFGGPSAEALELRRTLSPSPSYRQSQREAGLPPYEPAGGIDSLHLVRPSPAALRTGPRAAMHAPRMTTIGGPAIRPGPGYVLYGGPPLPSAGPWWPEAAAGPASHAYRRGRPWPAAALLVGVMAGLAAAAIGYNLTRNLELSPGSRVGIVAVSASLGVTITVWGVCAARSCYPFH